MVGCFAYGDTALVERFVDGDEVAVSVVDTGDGPSALPAVEILPDGGRLRLRRPLHRRRPPSSSPRPACRPRRRRPAPRRRCRPPRSGLRDLSRTDLIVDADGRPFLEVNVAPGMTETSLLPLAAEARAGTLATSAGSLLQNAASCFHA